MNITIITTLLLLSLIGFLGILWTVREIARQMRDAPREEDELSPEHWAYERQQRNDWEVP